MSDAKDGVNNSSLYSHWGGDPEIRRKAKNLRASASEPERVLWYYLRGKRLGGYRFRRQQSIGPFIVDFLCFEKRLIIELDGGQHSEQQEYDANRTKYLEAQGFHVVRFWNNDVMNRSKVVQEAILATLDRMPLES